ncbi:MAG: hypothetical protein U0800_06345 [Isosphaeraceae bacterium]
MLGDLRDPRWIYLKGALFVALGLIASALLLAEMPSIKVAVLLALAIWAFARAYYFAFCVVQQYVDPSYRYRGIGSFLAYLLRRRDAGQPAP